MANHSCSSNEHRFSLSIFFSVSLFFFAEQRTKCIQMMYVCMRFTADWRPVRWHRSRNFYDKQWHNSVLLHVNWMTTKKQFTFLFISNFMCVSIQFFLLAYRPREFDSPISSAAQCRTIKITAHLFISWFWRLVCLRCGRFYRTHCFERKNEFVRFLVWS